MKRKFIYICIFSITIILFSLSGCSNKENEQDLKTKANQELEYLSSKIIDIANKLNNIILQDYTMTSEEITLQQESSEQGSQSSGNSSSSGQESKNEQEANSQSQNQENQIKSTKLENASVLTTDENNIDWKQIKSEIEIINEAWGVVIVDLSNLNVDNNEILGFSTTLDKCILSIKDENKNDVLKNVAELYSFIPRLSKNISKDNYNQTIKELKSYLINAYSVIEDEEWQKVEENIARFEESFKKLTNDIETIKNKEYKINKTYVLLKELQNSLNYKDKKLFYIKYKNLMESINNL